MAKTMARIDPDNFVVNLESWPGDTDNTADLKSVDDLQIRIGDEWRSDGFYRNGDKILSRLEELELEFADAKAALAVLEVTDE